MGTSIAPHETAQGVLDVLAGVPLDQAAARIRMEPADLADAVEVYRTAGYAALEAQAADRGWYQVRVQFTDWDAAEHTAATRLGPHLQQIQDTGVVAVWWFIRKAPCWRLRLRRDPTTAFDDMKAAVSSVLDSHMTAGLIERWWETVYEPETSAFGGPRGMDIAHDLFHADSRSILEYLRPGPAAPSELTVGRRELSVLLCSALFRGAAQEWYEQGDVWHRVTQMRPLPPDAPTDRLREMTDGLRRLMTADARPTGGLFGSNGPLAIAAPWAAAFDEAGRALGAAAHDGTLERGVRNILAHHVIFHWNRLGLAARTQSILARAARDTVMNPPHSLPGARPARRRDCGHSPTA
ncbi:MAG: thiopeptide-type bacteriocin biosynthesis protein [Pseudonocardiaceae bacterium]